MGRWNHGKQRLSPPHTGPEIFPNRDVRPQINPQQHTVTLLTSQITSHHYYRAVWAQFSTSTGSIWPQRSPEMGEGFATTRAGDGSRSLPSVCLHHVGAVHGAYPPRFPGLKQRATWRSSEPDDRNSQGGSQSCSSQLRRSLIESQTASLSLSPLFAF